MLRLTQDEVEGFRASAQHDLNTLNTLRHETKRCVRQDPHQRQLIKQLKGTFHKLSLLDLDNAAEYARKIAVLDMFPRQEKPRLKRIA